MIKGDSFAAPRSNPQLSDHCFEKEDKFQSVYSVSLF